MKDLICSLFGHKFIEVADGFPESMKFKDSRTHYFICGRCLSKRTRTDWNIFIDGNTYIYIDEQ